MGTRTIRFDDLKPEQEADETVVFSIDRKDFEIDLASPNATELRKVLAPFIAAARRSGKGTNVVSFTRSSSTATTRQPARADKEQNQAMRDWAHKHGFKCSERGRIPAAVQDAYHNRDPKTDKPASNETAPRVNGAVVPTVTTNGPEPRNAATMDEFKTAFRVWAESRGLKINGTGLSAPPVVVKFSKETGLYKPNQTLPKAG